MWSWLKRKYREWRMRRWAKQIAKVTRQMHEVNAALMACSEAWRQHVEAQQPTVTVYLEGHGSDSLPKDVN